VSALGKVAKEVAKISKTSFGNMKEITKGIEAVADKLGEAAGNKAGGGDKKDGDMEAKMKELQDKMKQMSDLQADIQKSLVDITKNMK
jgi:hypothetical protein